MSSKSFIDKLRDKLITERCVRVGRVRKGGIWYIIRKLFNSPWGNVCLILPEGAILSDVEEGLASAFPGSVFRVRSVEEFFSLRGDLIIIMPQWLALSRDFIRGETLTVVKGEYLGYGRLLSFLKEAGYRRSEPPLDRGEFTVRGDVFEIRTPEGLITVSLYGEEVDYIGLSDPDDPLARARSLKKYRIPPPNMGEEGRFWEFLSRDSLVIWAYPIENISIPRKAEQPFLLLYREDIEDGLNIPWNPHLPGVLERELSFSEGDYVVHEDYGIAIFRGIKRIKVDGVEGDYLLLEYANGEKLYVPSSKIDKVSPYLGGTESPPLASLKRSGWSALKKRVKKNVENIAKELVRIYALRSVSPGYAFSKDTEWQREFEARFEYDETPDQLRAIEDVKRDMESTRPMDRLICGDVGYGKTEVAFRAAFKAVMDGKQVAFLCPTTVLAFQHYLNIKRRMEGFPVNVAMLSRFLSRREQSEVMEGIRKGSIDIVVGTHMLLSDAITFKDLGLLIIDEEQRFGVMQKEKLKKMRVDVDVLTLTATPIPRTLYLSLSGIKDISVINTPPAGRRNVEIYVGKWDNELVRKAIIRELERGGQVFVVHNRVEDLISFAKRISKLVPFARIGIAHGKMGEERLEKVMLDFISGEINVLICTTIIENGLDIPSANTLLVRGAERLGLAQLYQLRGRVGRADKQAYVYFLYENEDSLTDSAIKRLEAIKEFGELGSSLRLALRDMQIRGVGNILGPEQHGFVNAVGFHLYSKMLEEAITSLKGELPRVISAKVDLGLDAFIPEGYVKEGEERLYYYRRLIGINSIDDLEDLRAELKERFGEIPMPVENLFKTIHFKVMAEEAGVSEISFRKGGLRLLLHPAIWGGRSDVRRYLLSVGFCGDNLRFERDSLSLNGVQRVLSKTLTDLKEMREAWREKNLNVSLA
ncbi:MAG: transcription-repair coupling factor [Synergistetes bacterium]|nr:transcription-repair coupling factor [Synergistota bacterium]